MGAGLSLLVFSVGHKEDDGTFCHASSRAIVAEGILGIRPELEGLRIDPCPSAG